MTLIISDFARRVGREYVKKCIRDNLFTADTLRVAELWLKHKTESLAERARRLMLAATTGGIFVSLAGTVAVAVFLPK